MARAMAESDLYRRPWYSKPSSSTVAVCSMPFHSRTSRVPTISRSLLRTGCLPLTRASSSSISALIFASARAESPP